MKSQYDFKVLIRFFLFIYTISGLQSCEVYDRNLLVTNGLNDTITVFYSDTSFVPKPTESPFLNSQDYKGMWLWKDLAPGQEVSISPVSWDEDFSRSRTGKLWILAFSNDDTLHSNPLLIKKLSLEDLNEQNFRVELK